MSTKSRSALWLSKKRYCLCSLCCSALDKSLRCSLSSASFCSSSAKRASLIASFSSQACFRYLSTFFSATLCLPKSSSSAFRSSGFKVCSPCLRCCLRSALAGNHHLAMGISFLLIRFSVCFDFCFQLCQFWVGSKGFVFRVRSINASVSPRKKPSSVSMSNTGGTKPGSKF